ncbi:uncharacterized protein RJT21DRAFT_118837 [Scheffersomyces amazonensis]|uniref:uncharacterized protein n=1 Tax=Scheffersomyces amazonensis TaxID=1078765 RepID=UPI00315D73AD
MLHSSHDSSKSNSSADMFGNLIETSSSSSSIVLSSNHSPIENTPSNFSTRLQSSPKQQGKRSNRQSSKKEVSSPKIDRSQVIQYLRNEVNKLISKNIINNRLLKDEDKSSILDGFTQNLLVDHKDYLPNKYSSKFNNKIDKPSRKRIVQPPRKQSEQNKRSILNTWLNTSNANNTNLIPLSPLLNDSDSVSNTSNGNNSIDTLTQLPMININNTNITSSSSNNIQSNSNPVNFVFPSQVSSQIQNQNQQLPSFNSIQNNIPLSPSGISTINNSSLIPPLGNNSANSVTSATLTPAHILESSTKNLFNLSSSTTTGSASALTDFKLGGTLTSNIFSGQSLLNGGPNLMPANIMKDTSSAFLTSSNFSTLPSTNLQNTFSKDNNSNSNSNNATNSLLNNFNDPPW